MEVFAGISKLPTPPKASVITIGNFDGVHLGHQEIFRQVVEKARALGGTAVVLTFRPHPQVILNPDKAPLLLNTYEEKRELFAKSGLDWLVEEPFSRSFSETGPEQFIEKALFQGLAAKALYLGHDFGFGRGRAGSAEMIRKLGAAHGVEVHEVEALKVDGEVVSSSRIRACLGAGDIERANLFLGRPFFVHGLVTRGAGRGTTIGFPTANLQLERRMLPRMGVYITRVQWQGKTLPAITNVGKNPTFTGGNTENPVSVETHIFNFSDTIYGDSIRLEFHRFVRDEQKFANKDALVAQIKEDISLAKSWHKI